MRMLRGRWIAIAMLSFLLPVGVPATLGQEPNDAFPSVAGGPAPDWVQPGLRLTYYGEGASIRTSYYTYVEDPEGEWEDPITHKRYRQTEESEMPTAAGRAFTQTDVIAVDGDDVILGTTMVGIDLEDGSLSLIPLWGDRYAGAAVDGGWIHPDILARIASGGTPELRVLRGPYQLGTTTVDAVAFMTKADGTYASTVFDRETGAEVAFTGRAKGPGSPVHGPTDNPEGNVIVAWARLVNVRMRDVPGIGEALPEWVERGTSLHYTGTLTITNPFDAYGFEASYPVEVTVTIDDAGADWATFQGTTSVDYRNGFVDTSRSTGAVGAVGQYWYTPDALARLEDGQVLDDDPVTGALLTVEAVEPDGVTLRTEMNGVTVTATYDPGSGAMTTMTLEQGGYATTRIELASID